VHTTTTATTTTHRHGLLVTWRLLVARLWRRLAWQIGRHARHRRNHHCATTAAAFSCTGHIAARKRRLASRQILLLVGVGCVGGAKRGDLLQKLLPILQVALWIRRTHHVRLDARQALLQRALLVRVVLLRGAIRRLGLLGAQFSFEQLAHSLLRHGRGRFRSRRRCARRRSRTTAAATTSSRRQSRRGRRRKRQTNRLRCSPLVSWQLAGGGFDSSDGASGNSKSSSSTSGTGYAERAQLMAPTVFAAPLVATNCGGGVGKSLSGSTGWRWLGSRLSATTARVAESRHSCSSVTSGVPPLALASLSSSSSLPPNSCTSARLYESAPPFFALVATALAQAPPRQQQQQCSPTSAPLETQTRRARPRRWWRRPRP
jgi:hypothetical protein